jgi:hypothetical protein
MWAYECAYHAPFALGDTRKFVRPVSTIVQTCIPTAREFRNLIDLRTGIVATVLQPFSENSRVDPALIALLRPVTEAPAASNRPGSS